jgi:uncharacterized protein YdaU (DUF1376 family)
MKLWVDDALADVQEMGLTDEEFGVYWKLLLIAWQRGSIFADVAANSRFLTSSPAKLKKLWPAFAHKWHPNGDGGLVSLKMEAVRTEALGKSESARKAAETRWERERLRKEAEEGTRAA